MQRKPLIVVLICCASCNSVNGGDTSSSNVSTTWWQDGGLPNDGAQQFPQDATPQELPPDAPEEDVYCRCDYQFGDLPAGYDRCVTATTAQQCEEATCDVRYWFPELGWIYTTRGCGLTTNPDYYPDEPPTPEGCACPLYQDWEEVDPTRPNECDQEGIERDQCSYFGCWVRPRPGSGIIGLPQYRSCHFSDPPEPPMDEPLPEGFACGCPSSEDGWEPEDLAWDDCGAATTEGQCQTSSCGAVMEDGALYTWPCEVYSTTPPDFLHVDPAAAR